MGKYYILAVVKPGLKSAICEYVVADVDRVTEKKDGKYADIRRFTVEQLSYALKSGYKFENVEYCGTGNGIRFIGGSEKRYLVVNRKGSVIAVGDSSPDIITIDGNIKMPFIITAEISGNGQVPDGHTCIMPNGKIGNYTDRAIINDVENGKRILCNAKIVEREGKKFISLIKGSVEKVDAAEIANSNTDNSTVKSNSNDVKHSQNKNAVNEKQVSEPVNTAVMNQTHTQKLQQPSIQTVQQNVKADASKIFEVKHIENIGDVIVGVKDIAKEDIYRTFGSSEIPYPVYVGGKAIRIVDCMAFTCSRDTANEKFMAGFKKFHYVYGSEVTYKDEEDFMYMHIKFDRSGKTGFVVCDTMSNIKCIDFGGKLAVDYVNFSEKFVGTLLLPHVTNRAKPISLIKKVVTYGTLSVVALDNIIEIYPNALTDCIRIDLSSSSVKFIPKQCCKESVNLRKVLLSGYILRIHEEAFLGCSKLLDIRLPKSLVEIAENAFKASGLTSLTYEEGTAVKRVGAGAFMLCTGIRNIDLGFISGTISSRAFAYTGLKGTVIVPGSVKEIGSSAFFNTKITEFRMEEGVEKLARKAIGFEVNRQNAKTELKTKLSMSVYVPDSLIAAEMLCDNMSTKYSVHLKRGCLSESSWIVIKNSVKHECVNLIYDGLGEEEESKGKSLKEMIDMMGGIKNVEEQFIGGSDNDTPYTLHELLQM